jgi:uncharacterized damage-inducible protein DinB
VGEYNGSKLLNHMSQAVLKKQLLKLLDSEASHANLAKVLADVEVDKINVSPGHTPYSLWQLAEHIRRTQADILDYMKNPDYKEQHWPDAYWPIADQEASLQEWQQTAQSALADLSEIKKIVSDLGTDLFGGVPQNRGHTILREVLIVADHNSYHAGQLVLLRKQLGTWPE